MKFENSFTVKAPIDDVYAVLLDVERVAPCMPGAEVLERLGDDAYRVGVRVRLGPMSMVYRGQVEITERDPAAHTATMQARAKETRGQGTADAKMFMHLAEEGTGTQATIETDVQLSGRAAAMGQGMIADVSSKLVEEFAKNLANLVETPAAPEPAAVAAAAPAASADGDASESGGAPSAGASTGDGGSTAGGSSTAPASAPASAGSSGGSGNGAAAETSLPVGKIAAAVIGGRLSEPRTLAIATMSVVAISGTIGYAIGRSK